MDAELAFSYAEKIDLALGNLHNIGVKVNLQQTRRAYLDTKRSFQTARCERRRRRNFTKNLEAFVLTSKKLCELAEKAGEHPEIPLSVKASINAMDAALK